MEGKGPGFGDPRKVGLIIAGTDALAVDSVISKLLGVPPEHYPLLHTALIEGYDSSNLDDIVVRGKSLSEAAIPDFSLPPLNTQPGILRTTLMSILKGPLTTRPFIDKNSCLQCGNCFKACPVHCIVSHEDRFEITKRECIRCLCCMEVCPNGAVDLKDGFLLKLFQRKK
jgi:Pyruvate/2-oxoacid:ferredoxin oxidoreductase delta subunit